MPHIDADRARRPVEPITVTLRGQTFHCIPTLPWAIMEDLLARFAASGEQGIALQAGSLLRAVVVDDDLPALEQVLRAKSDPVDLDDVVYVLTALMEVYTGRPTVRPSDSPDGPPTSAPSSKVVSFSRGTVEASAG